MLEEVSASRLRAVERFSWHPEDGAAPNLKSGSVHLWFENGRGVHLDAASDWSLRWSVSEPGDDSWLGQYLYEYHGRWVMRDASDEAPFAGLVNQPLTSAKPLWNEVNEVVGLELDFQSRRVSLRTWQGEIDTTAR